MVGNGTCVPCGDARRCLTGDSHLLCGDGDVLENAQCTLSTENDVLIVIENHAVKCAESHFATETACGGCPEACVSCTNVSSCLACAAGTSLLPDGVCSKIENAAVQAHNGVVSCNDGFFASNGACSSCSDVFAGVCPSCRECDSSVCVACDGNLVYENGVWRGAQHCAKADGNVCTQCEDGFVPVNATDCEEAGECLVYADGKCLQCRQGLVPLDDGTCAESDDCTDVGQGVCLRCGEGMYADEGGVCKCLIHSRLTYSVR